MMSKWAKEFEKSGAVSIGVDPGASDETLVYIFLFWENTNEIDI